MQQQQRPALARLNTINSAVHTWRWVIVYSAFLLMSVSATREVIDKLEERGLTGLLGFGLFFLAAGSAFYLVRRAHREGRCQRLADILRLAVFLGVYAYFGVTLTSVTLERIHFVEYGILGWLCFRAVDPRHPQARRAVYATVIAFTVGFVDEVIQGIIDLRYYDDRDVIINFVAVLLPVLGAHWLSLKLSPPFAPLQRDPGTQHHGIPVGPLGGELQVGGKRSSRGRGHPLLTDGLVVVALGLIFVAMQWFDHVHWDLSQLPGVWERDNACGVHERMEIRADGTVLWEDALGNKGTARYSVGGNRLDGPQLNLRVLSGEGEGLCVWQEGMRRSHYFEVSRDRLVYKKRKPQFFTRVAP